MIDIVVSITVIVLAQFLPFNRPQATTKYPKPITNTIAPITILLLSSNWTRARNAPTSSVCGCWSCCCISVRTFSTDIDAKNALDTNDDRPPKINTTPLTMANMAMIVMPKRSFHWLTHRIFMFVDGSDKKNIEFWDYGENGKIISSSYLLPWFFSVVYIYGMYSKRSIDADKGMCMAAQIESYFRLVYLRSSNFMKN